MRLLWVGVAVLFCSLMPAQVQQVDGSMTITLVGTGGPELTLDRAGEATLVDADGQRLLFDAGRGVVDGLYRAQVLPQTVTRVFLTHLHSDHIAGLPDLWITPWFLLGRTAKLEVWGPVGTKAMVDGMRAMYAHDVEHRANAVAKRENLDVVVHEIAPGRVYDVDGVSVTAFAVEHADGDPAFAYRVEAAGHAVFLTGDCTYDAALPKEAQGVDVLISNVVATTPETAERWKPVLAKLMQPQQAARLFVEAKPRLAVYSHVVKKGLPGVAGDAALLLRTRGAGYAGPLRVGVDGMRIRVDGSIHVERVPLPASELDGPDAHF